jgi:predicted amidohydrolase YtcJ
VADAAADDPGPRRRDRGARGGRLAEGCIGDLVALDVDPLAASPEQCRDGSVLATVVGGELVFDAR